MTQITKEFELAYAHKLPNHSGKCKRLHGHNARILVTVRGLPVEELGVSDEGMVIDFGSPGLKQIVNEVIIDKWDHRFLANGDEVINGHLVDLDNDENVLIAARTTAENLARIAFQRIQDRLMTDYNNRDVMVEEVTWYETPMSSATFTMRDAVELFDDLEEDEDFDGEGFYDTLDYGIEEIIHAGDNTSDADQSTDGTTVEGEESND